MFVHTRYPIRSQMHKKTQLTCSPKYRHTLTYTTQKPACSQRYVHTFPHTIHTKKPTCSQYETYKIFPHTTQKKKPTCVPRDTHMPLHTRTHACAVTHSRSRHYKLNLHYCQFRSHDYLSGIPLSVSAYVIYWFVIGCN